MRYSPPPKKEQQTRAAIPSTTATLGNASPEKRCSQNVTSREKKGSRRNRRVSPTAVTTRNIQPHHSTAYSDMDISYIGRKR